MIEKVLSALRSEGGNRMRAAITGNDHLKADELANEADPGFFGPSSVIWRVHGEASMLIGGLRALLLQTLHPLAMAGVADHSDYRKDPWGRLHRTGRFIGATTYGNTATAEQMVARIRTIHDHVNGHTADGRPYAATDPHLLLWVHVTEVDSFLAAYNRYGVGALTNDERDQYVAETAEIGRRLGAENVPTDQESLAAALESFRPECESGPRAREAVRFLLFPPVPVLLRGAYGLIGAGSIGRLPSWARRQLGLPFPPGLDSLAVRPAASVLTRGIGWLLAADTAAQRRKGDLRSA